MEKVYEHKAVEDDIYTFWEEGGFFHSEPLPYKEKFIIMMPPPNITGRLHIGHAFTFTLQDIFTRFYRMRGFVTLWLPGMDHAGIATQSVVERELLSRGIRREDIGREKFIEEVWKWKEKYGDTILLQLKKLGSSPDWKKLRFTLDKEYEGAVLEAFVRYYKDGLIYQGERIINWCPHCHTAISDIEVEYENEKGKLYYIKYPFKDNPENFIVVATTRPETMLGDTAVAVNPDDERYKDLPGRILILPLVGREIPVVEDIGVDRDFGSGAVKVTPAHSVDDFDIAMRHNLDFVKVIDDKARMINVPEKYKNLTTIECREAVLNDLKEIGLLLKEEDYEHSVGHCQRCGTVVEPMISRQWFVKMKPLAELGLKAVESGDVKILPEKWIKVYYDWLKNIRDWCISRQLWWGHRIPAYYCEGCGEIIVSKEKPESCPSCDGTRITQDEDVLDTWFSSALWPFATLGWPADTEDLRYFYPTTLLITGYDILFFWVARMIMSGLYFTGEKPFSTVLLHGLIRDEKGRKMSKSLENIVDPMDIISEFGADTLRFTLAYLSTEGGQDISPSREKLISSRNFINKVWNASRFVKMNIDDFDPFSFDQKDLQLQLEDRWLISRLNRTIKKEIESLEGCDCGQTARALYDFVWGEFCDWYVELSKVRLYGEDTLKRRTAQYLLWDSLTKILKMLHPFTPFVTEKIYSNLPHSEEALVVSDFPVFDEGLINESIEKDADFVFSVIRAIRSLKTEFRINIVKPVDCFYTTRDIEERNLLETEKGKIMKIAGLSDFKAVEKKPAKSVRTVVMGTTIYLRLPVEVDPLKEEERLSKKLSAIEGEINSLGGRLANHAYLTKAGEEVIAKDREALRELEKLKDILVAHLEDLRKDA